MQEKREDVGSIEGQKSDDMDGRVKRDEHWRAIMNVRVDFLNEMAHN